MCQIDHEYITFFDDLSYSREIIDIFSQLKKCNVGVLLDTTEARFFQVHIIFTLLGVYIVIIYV